LGGNDDFHLRVVFDEAENAAAWIITQRRFLIPLLTLHNAGIYHTALAKRIGLSYVVRLVENFNC